MNREVAVCLLLLAAPAANAQKLAGLWDAQLSATLSNNPTQVPFRVQFSGSGKTLKAWFFNGDEKTISTSAEATPTAFTAYFKQYNSRLEATVKGDTFEGRYIRDGKTYPVTAVRHRNPPPPEGPAPQIGGSWLVATGNQTGEKAWRLVIRQKGAEVTGALLRVDGDTGTLTGRYAGGSFTMSHFSGARPVVFQLTPAADGSLNILQNGIRKLTAVKAGEAKTKGIPDPEDPLRHTTMRNPKEPLRFAFPDLDGHVFSSTDERFKGKVVIVSIGGSWCPNCHDEAPVLGDLYRKYHAQGLEIIELSFEEAEQLANPTRLREFIKDYGVEYPVVLAGEIEQLAAKLPQAEHLDAFPTTFFIGRDGLVHAIHSGFTGHAMGPLHDELVKEITHLVTTLLAER